MFEPWTLQKQFPEIVWSSYEIIHAAGGLRADIAVRFAHGESGELWELNANGEQKEIDTLLDWIKQESALEPLSLFTLCCGLTIGFRIGRIKSRY